MVGLHMTLTCCAIPKSPPSSYSNGPCTTSASMPAPASPVAPSHCGRPTPSAHPAGCAHCRLPCISRFLWQRIPAHRSQPARSHRRPAALGDTRRLRVPLLDHDPDLRPRPPPNNRSDERPELHLRQPIRLRRQLHTPRPAENSPDLTAHPEPTLSA